MRNNEIKVALIGNPNTGKTSIFNLLTGLQQKVGNYPGITVEKKVGQCKLSQIQRARIYDLPGTYSINPNSMDEKVAIECLLDRNNIDFPDVVVLVCDVENIKQNLLLFTQIKDLKIPTILAINMIDRMKKRGISLDIPSLEKQLGTQIVLISTRQKTGLEELKSAIMNYHKLPISPTIDIAHIDRKYFSQLEEKFPQEDLYKLWLVVSQNFEVLDSIKKQSIQNQGFVKTEKEIKQLQQRETILRYQFINQSLKNCYRVDIQQADGLRERIDRILIHKVWGYLIFASILLLIFQMIYHISEYPMGWIGDGFGWLRDTLTETLPESELTNLLTKGILTGIEGIAVFIPQISFLFLFISVLEESGYMSRIVFLMDKLMRPFGLSGKSVIPLVSGAACAIPAVMATRNIENWKERLISILVTPFITCSARLPIYLIIIEIVIPDGTIFFLGYKGLALFTLYVLGVMVAMVSAWILNKVLVLKKSIKTHFVIEMPNYKIPLWQNVFLVVYEKTKSFVFGAGKIILAISIILWFLQTHGFSEKYQNAETYVEQLAQTQNWNEEETANYLASYKTEHSLLGNIGKFVEPIFAPLGYDWKISIGVLWSFTAREVFISTVATIYSLGEDIDLDDEETQKNIIDRMKAEKHPNATPVYDLATGVSLLLFYAFAMQCLSTLAIVKKETNGWKWAFIQWISMTGFAYFVAFIAYQILK